MRCIPTLLVLLTALVGLPALVDAQDCTIPDTQVLTLETMSVVANLGIPNEKALLTELSSGLVDLVAGDVDGAVSELESFIKKVEAQSGKQIPAESASELIDAANEIIATLLCPCLGQEVFSGFASGDIPIDLCIDDGDDISLLKFEAGFFLGAAAGFDERNGIWVCVSADADGEDSIETTIETAVFCRSLLGQAASAAGVDCMTP